MAATVIVNGQTVVHKASGGQVVTTDVCLTPRGSSMVPVPYNNIAKSADTTNGSKLLDVDGNPIMHKDSKFTLSSGDNPGKSGVASGTVKGWAKFINYSNDTFVEGNPVCRRMDPMISNNGNTPPAPLTQPNNSAETDTMEGTHSFTVAFVSNYNDTVFGKVEQPLLEASWELTGPQTFNYKKKDGSTYFSITRVNCAEGEYELRIEFDGQKKKIPYEDARE